MMDGVDSVEHKREINQVFTNEDWVLSCDDTTELYSDTKA